MDLLQKSIIKLTLDGKIFYSTLLCSIEKVSTSSIPTAGVTIEDGRIYLYYNPKFLEHMYNSEPDTSMKLNRVCAILEHELLHLVYEHLLRAKMLNRTQTIYNIATDIAINQLISDLPENKFLSYDKFGLPPNKDAEYYYEQLIKNAIHIKVGGEGKPVKFKGSDAGKGVGSHSKWKNTSSGNLTKEVIRQVVKDAYKQNQKSRGYLPSHLEEQIKELLAPPTISWKTILKQYIGISIKTGLRNSWKRPNRRLGEEFKGKIAKRTIKMCLAIDTSGSVSDVEFKEFISEMKGIMNIYKANIEIIECDARIQKVYKLKPYSKVDTKFKGRGGTDYKPVFDYLKKKYIDLLIYFTDLYCDFEGCKPNGFDVIWVCTSSGNIENKPPFGKVVQIKNE